MNKKILAATIAAFLMTPVAFAAYQADTLPNTGASDDATDYQDVDILVPEVALIDISTTTVNLALTAPTDAGLGFTTEATDNTTTYDISANLSSTTSVTRTLSVQLSSTSKTIPAGGKLTIDLQEPDASVNTPQATFIGTTALSSATPVLTDIGNVVGGGKTITYAFGPETPGTMISYTGDGATADTLQLLYTLSND